MGIFNSFGAMSGQFAARQERSQVAGALIAELRKPGTLGELMTSLKTCGMQPLVNKWAAGDATPATTAEVQQGLAKSTLLDRTVQASNMPVGVVKSSLAALLPRLIRHLTVQGQLAGDGELTGTPLPDADQILQALC